MMKFKHRDWRWLRQFSPLAVVEHFQDRVGFTEVFEVVGGLPDMDGPDWQEMIRWGEMTFGHSPFLGGERTRWGAYGSMREGKVAVLIRRADDALVFKIRWC